MRYLYAVDSPPRPLLRVNLEARKVAMAAYLPGFYKQDCKTVVGVNPRVDTLSLGGIAVELLAEYGIAERIEKFALPVNEWTVMNQDFGKGVEEDEVTEGGVGGSFTRLYVGNERDVYPTKCSSE